MNPGPSPLIQNLHLAVAPHYLNGKWIDLRLQRSTCKYYTVKKQKTTLIALYRLQIIVITIFILDLCHSKTGFNLYCHHCISTRDVQVITFTFGSICISLQPLAMPVFMNPDTNRPCFVERKRKWMLHLMSSHDTKTSLQTRGKNVSF